MEGILKFKKAGTIELFQKTDETEEHQINELIYLLRKKLKFDKNRNAIKRG